MTYSMEAKQIRAHFVSFKLHLGNSA